MNESQIIPLDDWSNWKELPHDHFIYQIMKGREGSYTGLSNGLQRINKYIHGVQQGKIYLIGGASGGGKTTVSDFMFVLSTWLDAKTQGRPIKILYCSFEVSRRNKEAKWCAYYIGVKYGISLPIDYLLGRIENNYLSDDELNYVREGWQFVQEFTKDVLVLDDAVNPTAIYEGAIHEYARYGTVTRQQSKEDKEKNRPGKVVGYKPFPQFENMLFMLFIDHLKLTMTERGYDTKKTMDTMSGYCVKLKNRFKTTSVLLQQFNSELQHSRREAVLKNGGKNTEAYLIPDKLDFGDSKATYENADYVLGLVQPSQFQLKTFFGYDCSNNGFGNFFIMMFLMKNRESGQAGIMLPLYLNPITSHVYDLYDSSNPDPFMAQEETDWLDKARKLRTELARFVPIHKEETHG